MKKVILGIAIALLSFALTGCNNQIPTASNANSSANSKIIATVGKINITESQFAKQKLILKQNLEKMNKPQSDEFYNKGALYSLITNALIDNEVKKEGITVTQQQAIDYLNKVAAQVESLSKNDPSRLQFMDMVKANGFQSIDDYVSSKKVISAEQQGLAVSKFLAGSGQTYSQLADKLLAQKNYKILVPIDISGYQEELTKIDRYQ